MLIDNYKEITKNDLKLLRIIADIIAVKNEKHETFVTANELYYSQIIKDLLEGKIRSEKELKSRAISRKWVFKKFKRVLLVNFINNDIEFIKYVIKRITLLSNDIKIVNYEENLVMLVEYDDKARGDLIDNIKDVVIQLKQAMAISDEFDNMLEISYYYKQAQKTLQFHELFEIKNPITYYANYQFMDFLKNCCEKLDYSDYIHHVVKSMRQYDLSHNTQFCETLFCYLQNARSLTKTCKQMHLHKNTVNYRINQIKELFNPNLNNAEEIVHIYLSFSLLNISKKLDLNS